MILACSFFRFNRSLASALAEERTGIGEFRALASRQAFDRTRRRDAPRRVASREPVGQRFCVHLQLTGLSADCATESRARALRCFLPRLPVTRVSFLACSRSFLLLLDVPRFHFGRRGSSLSSLLSLSFHFTISSRHFPRRQFIASRESRVLQTCLLSVYGSALKINESLARSSSFLLFGIYFSTVISRSVI